MPATFALGPALLFCPADRPDRYAKAAAAADAVIIDLEDAVSPENRAHARESIVAANPDPDTTIVRVNPVGTDDFVLDLEMLTDTGIRTIMLAKTEHASDLGQLGAFDVIALCETVRGVENSSEIAAVGNVIALMWGAEDLIASLGGRSSRGPGGLYRDVARQARTTVLFAAAAHGKAAIDAVHLDIADLDGLRAEAMDAVAVGFSATACIHPSQVDTIRIAYAPTEDDLRWAQRLLLAAESSPGVFRFEGQMVDEPILRQARGLRDYRSRWNCTIELCNGAE
jgi:citrate lyase subunit beta / citryl-CoA lyase